MRYIEAPRHQGIEASRRDVTERSLRFRSTLASSLRRRAFSLTEVLLAVFILAIGIISIAALFPAGIAQQRLATDDAMGPVVANHAISVIRSRVKPEDFGSFDEFGEYLGLDAPTAFYTRTIAGDWGWMRPGFILGADAPAGLRGAIDLFSHYRTLDEFDNLPTEPNLNNALLPSELAGGWPNLGGVDDVLYGIPYDFLLHNFSPPRRIITQRERYYPMQSELIQPVDGVRDVRQPEYVWECMFRRYQGRVYVAIFVYRVTSPDDARARWTVPPNLSNENVPPLPIAINLLGLADDPDVPYSAGVWDVAYTESIPHRPRPYVPGIDNVNDFLPSLEDHRTAWQEHRQWLLDQNNNVHRVVGRQTTEENEIEIELSRPLQPIYMAPHFVDTTFEGYYGGDFSSVLPNSLVPSEYYANPGGYPNTVPDDPAYPDGFVDPPPPFFNWRTSFDRGVVTRLWYVPRTVEDEFGNEWRLTPVYVAVKEL